MLQCHYKFSQYVFRGQGFGERFSVAEVSKTFEISFIMFNIKFSWLLSGSAGINIFLEAINIHFLQISYIS